jgi:hypothetical protein
LAQIKQQSRPITPTHTTPLQPQPVQIQAQKPRQSGRADRLTGVYTWLQSQSELEERIIITHLTTAYQIQASTALTFLCDLLPDRAERRHEGIYTKFIVLPLPKVTL